ncbi:F0F1 ATP synthase subunit delta [Motiliproteus sediminis]|uniref:F0F1 ATP synthase subunit delta n=1 Tax=Motiliproteus sediminis TaxID=1468178 RepID=UPI001AEFA2B8|nr:F0F1 ATP synthase subunit delta [Motiliproteus sediminis]
MAELSTVARPYTKAAFQAAVEQQALDKWSDMLALAAQAVQDEQVSKLLNNPALGSDAKAELVLEICSDKLDEQAQNFIRILAENKRLPVLPEISALFDVMKAQMQQSIDVAVTTAFELNEEQQTKLAQALGKKLACEVSVTSDVDESLIGGAVIRAGDLVIDGSIRGKLAKLSETLRS